MEKQKFILNFAPTGMIPTKQMTPHVPIFPDEIISEVLNAANLGVNMVHLHARDPAAGGGVRIGLEDHIRYDQERTRLATNRDLIERIISIAQAMGRDPFSLKEARRFIETVREPKMLKIIYDRQACHKMLFYHRGEMGI